MSDRHHPLASPPASDHAATLDEVAQALNLSRERCRQIELRALRKLRYALEERGIDEDTVREYLHDLRARHG